MSSTTVTNRTSLKSISHEVKNGNLILTLSSLVNVGNISSMMLVMMNLHGGSINIRLESIKGISEVRDKVSVGSSWDSNSGGEGCSLGEEGTTTGSSILDLK